MNGKTTCVVLGAGASRCYTEDVDGIPMQQDLVGRLFFGADTSSGEGFPNFTTTFGLRHSLKLASHLRNLFEIPEDPEKAYAKLDFWTEIQKKGFNLESLYAFLEEDSGTDSRLLEDFEAVVRSAILEPVDNRSRGRVCKLHERIARSLEPGDFVVNFNWDSVMADALLYWSHFWFPATGCGVQVFPLLPHIQKRHPVTSSVGLIHVHGATFIYERVEEERVYGPRFLYVGPAQWSPLGGLAGVAKDQGIDLDQGGFVAISDEHKRRLSLGWIYLEDKWYRPVFVPPSQHKPQYESRYARTMRRLVHRGIPDLKVIVIAGYSFPPADLPHLGRIFVEEVMSSDVLVQIVNLDNDSSEFRDRVRQVFPNHELDFSVADFREFCSELPSDEPVLDSEQLAL